MCRHTEVVESLSEVCLCAFESATMGQIDKILREIVCCMYVWSSHIAEMDQPDKVASPARGQLNRGNEYSTVPVRA